MFLRKKRDEDEINEIEKKTWALSYPIGRAAEMLGFSKKTLLRHAEAMNLSFEWDKRGRRIRADDIQKLLGNSREKISYKKRTFDEGEISLLREQMWLRVWQKWRGGIVEVRGDFFYNPLDGCIEEAINSKFGAGDYTLRCILNDGILSEKCYKIKIAGYPRKQPQGKQFEKWMRFVTMHGSL